ncbi:MAG: hypothetical protein GJ680_07365 [Alteromonadaceae bacterium]|nr:hypothetical protein [Alteromonadaceae bacterium]
MRALRFKITIPDGPLAEHLSSFKSASGRNHELYRLATNSLLSDNVPMMMSQPHAVGVTEISVSSHQPEQTTIPSGKSVSLDAIDGLPDMADDFM